MSQYKDADQATQSELKGNMELGLFSRTSHLRCLLMCMSPDSIWHCSTLGYLWEFGDPNI